MNILAIMIAAVAGFTVGGVWYSVLSKQWMAAAGMTEEDVKGGGATPVPFVIAGLGALLGAWVLESLLAGLGQQGLLPGLLLGLKIGALVATPWIILHYAFSKRPKALWWIDGGHTILSFAVMGAITGIM